MDEILVIQNTIHEIRGYKVMLDSDLARLYEVETRVLNQAVKRNLTRFPIDFMFQLTGNERETLISQIVTSKTLERRGGRQKLPYAFTEQGVAMLSSVINSDRAIAVNIQIMRVFSQMRQYALVQGNTNERIADLRQLLMLHIGQTDKKFEQNDSRITEIFILLNNLIEKSPERKMIGFKMD
jgi:hypothetical protein